ncbi:Glyoxylase, beta-lactamase superfamily II [Balnearium lithotrophicum]|uniref:Glyoxylase, beta-lactamase superfamily II n=1 Tax=Balnearium lithotrophicum TaxID=223788 RepID=A0A521DB70_9BACT|nr:MBL fold metallo-hydrolase [Balnearium lithotrophicum]SMO68984.1 Glyoxylase, beta-lactamase superfamily II [Balnearium lithotrophicum]
MRVKVFPNAPFLVNTILFWDEETKEAAVVDPGSKEVLEDIEDIVDRENLNVVYVINTHEHPDHTAANAWAKLKFPEAKLIMHPEAKRNLNFWVESEIGLMAGAEYSPAPDRTVNEGDVLKLGNSELRILHTPGHSPGSIVLYSPTDRVAFVGDLIFKGSIGRYDLPMSDFSQLKSSIFKVLKELPQDTVLIPGHGEKTTIGEELRENPFIRGLIR